MFEQIINTLGQSGWTLETIEGNWIRATHSSLNRGLILGNLSDLPDDSKHWVGPYANISKWDVIVFCPEGIDSSQYKQHHFGSLQLWYWDTKVGNLFPYPPSNDQLIPQWIRLLASGKSVIVEGNSRAQKSFVPFLTYIFLGINLVVFLLMTLAGGSTNQQVLIDFGAKVNTLIQAGEVWRLLTSTFIHIGTMHLVFNLYALWALGPLSEESYGHRRFFMIYILSGLGGSTASFLFSPALSAGASGAIFGLLGALLYYSYKRPALWKSGLGMNLVVVILVNFGFGLVQPGIDNFAHLGGLVTGAITCIILSKTK